ncbi:carbohydrate ABC transporter permease [Chitinimonas taiwanensis]|jgi:glucose/mannose transport system permease protein|uniref:Glucose/mannose transport system permease protein n=1 Tax=Chitinimonas taiwanensis DSM 18899 TaxID=1121279 RepID=A0A1K2HGG1_9NEIS|nr:sugar ABC transporter permease [Chitinimonas taiwanensis]SFZ75805.1 glucose/mannose transport system permease protein [Chitinimonas taiwanensis DSM 18899]
MTAASQGAPGFSLSRFADTILPKLVIAPTVLACLIGFYAFIGWTAWLSFTESRLLPRYEWAGFVQYIELFGNDRWWTAMQNLAVFGGLFIFFGLLIGLVMAVLLDQKIRGEGAIRTIYLYPMALSFIVTGTAWKWILNPGLGVEKLLHDWGFTGVVFDWIINPDFAIYTVVIAGIWQSSGFVMALFLAGLRGVDDSIIKAAQMDGASLPTIYTRIIIPSLRPVFLSAFMILAHIAVKSFDLVMALTGGGPGFATDLPSIFMYQHGFTRGQLGLGAASAMMMLFTVAAVVMPFLYSELRRERRG